MAQTLSPAQHQAFADLARKRWGFSMNPRKRKLIDHRVASLLDSADIADPEILIQVLLKGDNAVLEALTFDALSTNHTHFFREQEHLDFFGEEVQGGRVPRRGLRVWSAGCANGAEPYSIAMTLAAAIPDPTIHQVKILATDYCVEALRVAKAGRYSELDLRGVSRPQMEEFFEDASDVPYRRVSRRIRDLVSFGRVNLIEPWSIQGPFDAVFCRNVMIYFDEAVRRKLVRRFVGLLKPGGHFFIGLTESLSQACASMEPVKPGVYRKVAA